MERRDVAGHRGSGESAYKRHSKGAHVRVRQLLGAQARTAALAELGPLGVIRYRNAMSALLPLFP
jgi:hypothetical protein